MQHTFHGFDIYEKIGSGGMSTVYRGKHQTLGYPVAVKILHPGLVGDTNFIKRFEREAKAASALRCNNIASVIDFGTEDDVYCIVMEYIEGSDLAKIFEEIQNSTNQAGAFPIEIALLLIEEVTYGLKEAHEHGLIHRDIKPANILIDKRGEVKIADFGLARDTSELTHANALDLTTPGTVLGTPSYMSPEQAAGKSDLDMRTDIFSLGVMAYQLVTGQKPFQADTPTAVQEKIINDEPIPLTRENCPLLTSEIEVMIAKMLAKDPQKRYSTTDRLLRGIKESIESIDLGGNLSRYRRDYLSNFAKEPVAFSEELRTKSVSSHLKLGYHFKNQGFSNIDDAIREFTYVLSIDPENTKAADALRELRRRQEEQGDNGSGDSASVDVTQVLPGESLDPGVTMIMPGAGNVEARPTNSESGVTPPPGENQSPPAPPPPPPPEPETSGTAISKRRFWMAGGAVAILAIIALFWGLAGRSGDVTGSVELLSEPPGAQVWLRPADATDLLDSGRLTDCVLTDLNPGSWEIELRHKGFHVAAKQCMISAGDTLSLSVPLSPMMAQGDLIVESQPVGAKVHYRAAGTDQAFTIAPGTTPLQLTELAVGSYDLKVELVGYEPHLQAADIRDGTETAIKCELTALVETAASGQGRMTVTSRPAGATVQVRRRGQQRYTRVGVTPYTSDLLEEGRWDIRVALEGYEPAGVQGRIRPDETKTFDFPLKKLAPVVKPDGYARLVISPFGDVFVDGQRYATETKLAVLPLSADQSHRIEIRHNPTYGKIVLDDVRVASNDTLLLPRQVFRWATMAVSSNAECEIMIDDRWNPSQRRLQLPNIGVGEHVVSVRRPGFTVENVLLMVGSERRELDPIDPQEVPRRYQVVLEHKTDVKIHFRLKAGN